ncbi:esterase family protein [Cytobacillus sp. IB215665]|uniref:alpha/beta hydrolase n=1 Tax=Cytobacillus sp. IB215665 TaxID=3097357 RepID=UPI002A131A6B|nr:esterase family protein [Cytobacillus sp. IB215665]MDX8366681.1 esterase family protein [Cytobacillus sp. IB215665]
MNGMKGKIKEVTLMSEALNEEVQILIYEPVNFSPLYKYHVLIAQDGQDYLNLGKIARLADHLLSKKQIDNTIIVAIPYKDVNDRKEKYHPNGEKHQQYIRFLADELTPYIDKEYPTFNMGMGRILLGDSLGGTVSLLAALTYPHTFGKIIMQSPYVNNHVIDKVKDFKLPHQLELYHVIGKQETEVKTTDGQIKDFIKPNRELHDVMKKKSYPIFYNEFDGDHTWTYWQPDLSRALKMMLSM